MPWWRIFKRSDEEDAAKEQDSEEPRSQPRQPVQPRTPKVHDPATRARRRERLERRVRDLTYDIALAESALQRENRWNKRVEELDAAVEQARQDIKRLSEPPEDQTSITLPSWPVVIEHIRAEEPSEVRFRIGDVPFLYSEEIDWAERGHQRADLVLRHFEGDVTDLIPPDVPAERRDELAQHLSHSVSALAVLLRDNELEGRPQPELTLSDLAKPCPECGGWRDVRDRCLACQQREWQKQEINAEIQRLIDERDSQLNEVRRWQESLPVLRRQLENAERELQQYV